MGDAIGVMDRSIFNPTKSGVEECERRFGADDPAVKMIKRIYDKQNLTVPLAMVSLPPGKNPEDYGWKIITKDGEDYAVRTMSNTGGTYIIPARVVAELGDGDPIAGEDILKKLTFVGYQFYLPADGSSKFYNKVVGARTTADGIISLDDPRASKTFEAPPFEEFAAGLPDRITHVAADDPAQPTGPTKPYNEAVNDVHRYLKEVVEKLPESQADGSVKEGVQDDLGKAIEKRKAQKPWPSALGD